MTKLSQLTDRVIFFSYLSLAIITPLLFSTQNTELFEVPKMLFVYLMATIIFFMTLIRFVFNGKIVIPKNLVLAAFALFIAVQVLSTFFSIDKFTSVFGYPSRLNGGLLSQFAYLVIFAGALINLTPQKAQKLIIATIIAAFAVSLWGIPAHFGRDPSCFVLTGQLTSTCWQKDFDPTLRIFSTLGQPNWLAAYLILILPFSLVLLFLYKKPSHRMFFAITTAILFLAFIFTNSRAGFAGLAISVIIFIILLGSRLIKSNFKSLIFSLFAIFLISAIFGRSLFSRFYESISRNLPTSGYLLPTTQIGGTESGQIRLIVWQGALKVFLNYPLLGTGPETFAYSYYLYRPFAHNNTTEWNFFYNKAHNEFLNYLATLGLFGTTAYLSFIMLSISQIYKISKAGKLKTSISAKAAISAIFGYQATIFFGFSTVATQLLMYLLIAAILVQNKQDLAKVNLAFKKRLYQKILIAFLFIFFLWEASFVIRLYFADLFASRAKEEESSSLGNWQNALETFPGVNPFYLTDYAYTLATYAVSQEDPEVTSTLIEQTAQSAEKALLLAPNNLINIRKLANSYLLLSANDQKYESIALELGETITKLAPTDPQSYLSLAKIHAGLDLKEEAKISLEIALKLKPDYLEAKELLEQLANSTIDN